MIWAWIAVFLLGALIGVAVRRMTKPEMQIREDRVMTEATPVPIPEPTEQPETWVRYAVGLDDDLQRYIEDLCIEYEIPASIVFAVIEAETGGTFDPESKGDYVDGYPQSFGLMQIWESEHHGRCLRLNAYNLFDPRQNVRVGIDYLAELIGPNWYDGDWKGALSFYNSDSTGTYAEKVLHRAEQLMESAQLVSE